MIIEVALKPNIHNELVNHSVTLRLDLQILCAQNHLKKIE
jgi:hypothetical protein